MSLPRLSHPANLLDLVGISTPRYPALETNSASKRRDETGLGDSRWIGSLARTGLCAIRADDWEEGAEEEDET